MDAGAKCLVSDFPTISSRAVLRARADVLARPCPVPQSPGVYAWFFATVPPGVDAAGCHQVDGLTLLYVGISPKEPPTNGRAPSRSTLRHRLRTHYAGNAEGSTLRKTLGCLLGPDLGIALRRVGSGTRYTFTNPGEQALDAWMQENALVGWLETDRPWELERSILQSGLPLPLNVRDNPSVLHTSVITSIRRAAVRDADGLPIIADGGGPRRMTQD